MSLFLLSKYPAVELLVHRVVHIQFYNMVQRFSIEAIPWTCPAYSDEHSGHSTVSGVVALILVGVQWDVVYIYMMTDKIMHFMCFLVIPISSFVMSLFL